MRDLSLGPEIKLISIAGKAGAGKDTIFEHVLEKRGFIRWPTTLHYKIWMVATGQGTYEEVFYTKPPHVRTALQNDCTAFRETFDEEIWLRVMSTWFIALQDIVRVKMVGIAVTDSRFLAEIRGLKKLGAKTLHVQARDEMMNLTPEQRTNRSETELDSPEMETLRDAHILNQKKGLGIYIEEVEMILWEWGWS